MDIQVGDQAKANLKWAFQREEEEKKNRAEFASHIHGCLYFGICPQCGEALTQKKSKWFSWILDEKFRCSGCKIVFTRIPHSYSIYDPGWKIDEDK